MYSLAIISQLLFFHLLKNYSFEIILFFFYEFFLVISLLRLKNLKLLPRFKNKLSQKDLKKIHTPSNKYQKKNLSHKVSVCRLSHRDSLYSNFDRHRHDCFKHADCESVSKWWKRNKRK